MITARYDAEADTLDIVLGPARGRVTTHEVGETALVDIDAKGRVVSIEIHQASHFYPLKQLQQLPSFGASMPQENRDSI